MDNLTFTNLPDELIMLILSFIMPFTKDAVNIMCVCKLFYNLFNNSYTHELRKIHLLHQGILLNLTQHNDYVGHNCLLVNTTFIIPIWMPITSFNARHILNFDESDADWLYGNTLYDELTYNEILLCRNWNHVITFLLTKTFTNNYCENCADNIHLMHFTIKIQEGPHYGEVSFPSDPLKWSSPTIYEGKEEILYSVCVYDLLCVLNAYKTIGCEKLQMHLVLYRLYIQYISST